MPCLGISGGPNVLLRTIIRHVRFWLKERIFIKLGNLFNHKKTSMYGYHAVMYGSANTMSSFLLNS